MTTSDEVREAEPTARPTRARDRATTGTENPSGVPGTTEVFDEVVASIAGNAAAQVTGVVRLGTGGLMRSVSDAVDSGSSGARSRGVKVEVGRHEAIFEIELTVEYGYSIPTIVEDVRQAVSTQIKAQAGLEAKEVNLKVIGIDFPEEQATPTSRVQ